MKTKFKASVPIFYGGWTWEDSEYFARYQGPSLGEGAAAQRRLRIAHTDEGTERYDPFQDAPVLFAELARTPPTEEAIVEFANSYGLLFMEPVRPSLLDWQETILDLQAAEHLRQAVMHHDNDAIKEHVRWNSRGKLEWPSRLVLPHGHRYVEATVPREYRPGELLAPARTLLDFTIRTKPLWSIQVTTHRVGDQLSLCFEVDELLYILWIQFALAVESAVAIRSCQHCGHMFEEQAKRSDAAFCSDNCRVKDYQGRRRKAKQMHAGGATASQIAKQLGSDTETVKGWLSKGDK